MFISSLSGSTDVTNKTILKLKFSITQIFLMRQLFKQLPHIDFTVLTCNSTSQNSQFEFWYCPCEKNWPVHFDGLSFWIPTSVSSLFSGCCCKHVQPSKLSPDLQKNFGTYYFHESNWNVYFDIQNCSADLPGEGGSCLSAHPWRADQFINSMEHLSLSFKVKAHCGVLFHFWFHGSS